MIRLDKNEHSFLIKIFLIGLIVFLICNFFIQVCFVSGNSMNPTYKNGQPVIVLKFNYEVENGDVVIVKKNKKTIIKRVIGTPHDRISIIDGYIYLNGRKYDELILNDYGNVKDELILGENEYFLLGDNRNNSIDSRFDEIGIIHKKDIVGKIIK